MNADSGSRLSAEELSAATGESIDRLYRLRSLGLIGAGTDTGFGRHDIERVRLIRFLGRRQISLETVARAEREEEILSSVIEFLFADGAGPTYSLSEAADLVGLDAELARRLTEAGNAGDDPLDEHDVRMLREAKVALDAGFPEAALLQLARVYADAQSRVAEAEVHLFHFYVHEGLKVAGLSGQELRRSRRSVRDQLLPVADRLIRYFHRRAMVRAVREDMLLHLDPDAPRQAHPGQPAQLRLAVMFLDISSYTPITEVMGDAVAANIVERFSELVHEEAARSDGRIVDRVGDAFLLVFPDPRAAIICGLEIERRASAEPRFPAVRGAVHWGDLLYREGGYVGGSLNIASRVATQATPHQILATAAARAEAGDLAGVTFAPLGTRRFKGLTEEVELFEVRPDDVPRGERARDPVCGMEMAPDQVAATLLVKGRTLAFCCEKCLRLFLDASRELKQQETDLRM